MTGDRDTSLRRARIKHKCSYCNTDIRPGQTYHQVTIAPGVLTNTSWIYLKVHLHCRAFIKDE